MLVLRRPRLRRTTGGQSSSPRIHHRSSDSTATQRSRRTHRTRREKPTNEAQPRPILSTRHRLCQTAHLDLTEMPDNTHLHQTPGRKLLRDDALNKEETQQRLHRPIPDLRFPSGAPQEEERAHLDEASKKVRDTRRRRHRPLRPKPEQGFLPASSSDLQPERTALSHHQARRQTLSKQTLHLQAEHLGAAQSRSKN